MKKNLKMVYGLLGSACFCAVALHADFGASGQDDQMPVKSVESIASVMKEEAHTAQQTKEPAIIFNIPIRRYHEKIANEKMRNVPVVTDMGDVIEEKDGVTFHLRHKKNVVVAPYDASASFVSYQVLDELMQQQDYVSVVSVV